RRCSLVDWRQGYGPEPSGALEKPPRPEPRGYGHNGPWSQGTGSPPTSPQAEPGLLLRNNGCGAQGLGQARATARVRPSVQHTANRRGHVVPDYPPPTSDTQPQ